MVGKQRCRGVGRFLTFHYEHGSAVVTRKTIEAVERSNALDCRHPEQVAFAVEPAAVTDRANFLWLIIVVEAQHYLYDVTFRRTIFIESRSKAGSYISFN